MKILIVSTPQKLRRTKHLWAEMGRLATVEHQILGAGTYADLHDLALQLRDSAFDRIIVDHNLRRMGAEYRHLSRIPNLVIFDFDFCQNYLPEAGCRGELEAVLKTLKGHRIIVSSTFIRDDLRAKGFDAEYSSKAYDAALVQDLGQPRDIELGFIGRSHHRAYRQRKKLLDCLQLDFDLQVLRTEENEEYNQVLNRIKIFVVPDLGYHELMIKNFEALAAGCVLVTARPSPEETRILGLVDMENVVFYESYEELRQKLAWLKTASDFVARTAQAGRQLAMTRHRWEDRAAPLLERLRAPLRCPPRPTWGDRWKLLPRLVTRSKRTSRAAA